MLWGGRWSFRWGDPQDHFVLMDAVDLGDGARARFQAQSGWEQWARLVIDGVPVGPPFMSQSDQIMERVAPYGVGTSPHAVTIAGQGDWAGDDVEVVSQQVEYLADRDDRITITTTTGLVQVYSYGDSSQFSSWSLSGLKRFLNCSPVNLSPQYGLLELRMETDGSDHTVNLYKVMANRSVLVSSGSRTGDGSVTLSAQNDSGLSGSVTLTYSADIGEASAFVVGRFPERLRYHYQEGTPWTAPDFPRSAEGTVVDDGHSNSFTFRSPRLDAGTYYVVVHQVDELGNEGSSHQAGGLAVPVYTPPEPPTSLVYSSGQGTWGEGILVEGTDPPFFTTGWMQVQATIAEDVTGPWGQPALSVRETTDSGEHGVSHIFWGSFSNGDPDPIPVTVFAILRGGYGRQWVAMEFHTTSGNKRAWCDLDTGAIGTVSSGVTALSVVPLGDDWHLFPCQFQWPGGTGATPIDMAVRVADADGSISNGVGDPSKGFDIAMFSYEGAATAKYPTVVSWTASETSGATYALYDSGSSGLINIQSPVLTRAANDTIAMLPPVGSVNVLFAYTGDRHAVVRAVKSGVEEGNNDQLLIAYSSGEVVTPRPPTPRPGTYSTSGRTLTVSVAIQIAEQAVAGATLQLFVVAYGSAIDYDTPQATKSLTSLGDVQGIIRTTISYTAGGNGNYSYAVRAVSAAGKQSDNTDVYGPVVLSTATPPDPDDIQARAGL